MISVQEAKNIIGSIAVNKYLKVREKPLSDLLGNILCENVLSKVSSPPFHQSAMDGYAINGSDLIPGSSLKVRGENAAGKYKVSDLKRGECIRIYTGAKLPVGADTVIPQEYVSMLKDNSILFDSSLFKRGDNVRPEGSHFKKGELLMKKGAKLNTHSITMLAACGYSKAKVYIKPSVSILVTGSELVKPGKKLSKDKIPETNSIMLRMALKTMLNDSINTTFAQDTPTDIHKAISKSLKNSTVLLITGGVSVGKYDFVKESLQKTGVKTLFHKIKQKPGKPLLFGKHKNCLVFGLPGNPAASLTCFYEYVRPLLKLLSGENNSLPEVKTGPVLNSYNKKAGLSHFLKGRFSDLGVEILNDQESYKISSFNEANCLVYLPEEITEVKSGDIVSFHILPHYD